MIQRFVHRAFATAVLGVSTPGIYLLLAVLYGHREAVEFIGDLYSYVWTENL